MVSKKVIFNTKVVQLEREIYSLLNGIIKNLKTSKVEKK